MSLQRGTNFLHYQLVEKLGEGGMGVVWRATDTSLGREVAIKVLSEQVAESGERLARFEREAKLLATLNHPGIAAVYGLHESDDGQRFIAMELVAGNDLSVLLANGPLDVNRAISLAGQIAEALEVAHEQGVIHRDLKPANIVVGPDDRVTVLDFGLAKVLEADPTSGSVDSSLSPTLTGTGTLAGMLLGTAGYMSPEQARGLAVDKRADIWAFGVVLYEMLVGRSLFGAATVTDVLAGVLKTEIDFDALPESTPASIRRLVRRCLQRDPRNRLRDIGDARIAITESLAGGSAEPEPAAAGPRPVRRTALALVALAAAVGGALLMLMVRPEPPRPEPVCIRRLTSSGADLQPSASPDGRFVAFASARDGTSRIWLKQMDGGGEQALTEGPDFLPRFTPDGNGVGFLRRSGAQRSRYDLYRIALVGGQPRHVLSDVGDFDWSPRGDAIAYIRYTRGSGSADVYTLGTKNLDGSGERTVLEVEGWLLIGPRWSPDGSRIAVTRGGAIGAAGGWKILLVDPASGAVEELDLGTGLGAISTCTWDSRSEGLYYAASADTVGDLSGRPGELRYMVPGGTPRTLFWASGLFPFRGSETVASGLARLEPDRLVFDTWEQSGWLREVGLADGVVRELTGSLATDRQPAYSPDGRQIVFSSNRTGNLDLWMLDRSSGQLRQLTDDPAQDWDPGFTPDGNRILFSSGRGGNHLEIWSIAADGSDARQVSHDGVDAENPTMTADGRWIVYTSGNPAHLGLFRIRPDGSEATRITSGNHTNGEISPDGRWALFVASSGLWGTLQFVEVETGRLAARSIPVIASEAAPSITLGRGRWLGDGSEIAFVGTDERGRSGIFVRQFDPDRDTSATIRKLAGFFDDVMTESFGIAPDGSSITLAVTRETRRLMLAEGLPE